MRRLINAERILISLLVLTIFVLPISSSNGNPTEELEKIRAYSRIYEFDYVTWTLSALGRKLVQSGLNPERYLTEGDQHDLVLEYLDLANQTNRLEIDLKNLLANPAVDDQTSREERLRSDLADKVARRNILAPYVEQVLQDQINSALIGLDMSLGGQLVPPVLYRSEPNSMALIVSPRDEVRQVANLLLIRGLELDQIITMEEKIEDNLDLSALVVGVGGVGLYPSMIIETPNLDWMIHVISHEWTHNYLTIRPLGAAYNNSPEMTTINETIADLSADDIQQRVFQLYYPEYLSPELVPDQFSNDEDQPVDIQPLDTLEPPVFDFREQMHITRLEVDRLLVEGRIDEAESYMELRREFFWKNGYNIRKLNQAYFAFHGSYAADPGGAADQEGAGLGSLLRDLKAGSTSYREFMQSVAWKWKQEQFKELFDEMD